MDIIEKILEIAGIEWIVEIGFIQNGNLAPWSILIIVLGFFGFRTIIKSYKKYKKNITEVEKETFVMKLKIGIALTMLTTMVIIGLNLVMGHNEIIASFIRNNGINQLFTTATVFGPPILIYKKVTDLYAKAILREDEERKEKLKKEKEKQQEEKKNRKQILLL